MGSKLYQTVRDLRDGLRSFVHRRLVMWRAGKDFQRYHYPNRILFVAGLPKSGTEWINAMLQQIPGYHRAIVRDSKGLMLEHTIDEEVFASIPSEGYFVLKTHIEASEKALAAIKAFQLQTLVMWRDLRDQAVSRYCHILNEQTHRHHQMYKQGPRDVAISHSVDIVLEEFKDWVEDWLEVIEADPEHFKGISYEQLRDNPHQVLSDVLTFYGISLTDEEVTEIIDKSNRKTKQGGDLRERLAKGSTFRSGKSGEWRSYFSQRDVDRFKDVAGAFLIRTGYEKDLDWGL